MGLFLLVLLFLLFCFSAAWVATAVGVGQAEKLNKQGKAPKSAKSES
jgi:hypothetical protein